MIIQPRYFDFLKPAREAGLSDAQIEHLVARWREDYGSDDNLLELRLLRVCRAIANGNCTFEQAIAPEPIPAR